MWSYRRFGIFTRRDAGWDWPVAKPAGCYSSRAGWEPVGLDVAEYCSTDVERQAAETVMLTSHLWRIPVRLRPRWFSATDSFEVFTQRQILHPWAWQNWLLCANGRVNLLIVGRTTYTAAVRLRLCRSCLNIYILLSLLHQPTVFRNGWKDTNAPAEYFQTRAKLLHLSSSLSTDHFHSMIFSTSARQYCNI